MWRIFPCPHTAITSVQSCRNNTKPMPSKLCMRPSEDLHRSIVPLLQKAHHTNCRRSNQQQNNRPLHLQMLNTRKGWWKWMSNMSKRDQSTWYADLSHEHNMTWETSEVSCPQSTMSAPEESDLERRLWQTFMQMDRNPQISAEIRWSLHMFVDVHELMDKHVYPWIS